MTRYTQYNKQEATIAKLEDENRKLKEKLTEMRAMVDSAHDQLGEYHKVCNDYSELVEKYRTLTTGLKEMRAMVLF